MPYLTKEQLSARVGGDARLTELIHDPGATPTQDNEVLAQLLADVDAEADGYFRAAGYAIPLPDALLPQVKNLLLDLASFKAKTRGLRDSSDDDKLLWKAAIARLTQIGQRQIVLLATTPSSDNLYLIDSEKGLFDRSSMRGW